MFFVLFSRTLNTFRLKNIKHTYVANYRLKFIASRACKNAILSLREMKDFKKPQKAHTQSEKKAFKSVCVHIKKNLFPVCTQTQQQQKSQNVDVR